MPAAELEPLDLRGFSERLEAVREGVPQLGTAALHRLHSHYEELRRWAPRLDLIGPGAAAEIFRRHYGEALEALDWLPAGAFRLVDVGSGAGFPGFVLAAARPDAEVWLVEPRHKRLAFLAAAARRAGLAVHAVDARVAASQPLPLPEPIDVVTIRAVRLPPRDLSALARRLDPGGRLIVWEGGEAISLPPELRPGRRRRLAGSEARYLAEYLPASRSS